MTATAPSVVVVKPVGRTLTEFEPLRPAERALLEACRTGEVAPIGDQPPDKSTDENRIRAAFLRFLVLGGDANAPIHEHGVQLTGAWIEGKFDLKGSCAPYSLALLRCAFDAELVLRDATIAGGLSLSGSRAPGIQGDRLVCQSGVFLRNITASGAVRLGGAQIGGDISCSGAKLDGKKGDALSADRAVVKGGVFLNEGFTANGAVRLLGAQIGGNLECTGAKLDGKEGDALSADGAVVKGHVFLNEGFAATGAVRLLGAQIGGSISFSGATLDGKEGRALSADHAVVAGALFFRRLKQPVNGISLASVRVGQLVDDAASWGERLVLDGFTYDALAGGAPTDTPSRLAWLERQRPSHWGTVQGGADFRPQPWQQLISVLRAMGHEEEARQVAIAREEHLRSIGKIGQTPPTWGRPRAFVYRSATRGSYWLFGLLAAYGYRPIRVVGWLLGVWLACGAMFWWAALQGVFAPTSPLVFSHPAYAHCRPTDPAPLPTNGKPAQLGGKAYVGNWYLCEDLAGEYTTFSPLAYSLDLILPLVDLQQEHDWAPMIATPKRAWYEELVHLSLNHWIRLIIWFEILFGWLASLLLVAVVSGLTNRDKN